MASIKLNLSPVRIASLVIGVLMLLSTVFLSWLDFSGLTLNTFDLFGWFSLILILGAVFFIVSIFLGNRKLSGLIKLIIGIIELLIWTAVLFLIMMPLAEFMPSVSSLLGSGFWLFLISIVAILAIGLMETLGWGKRKTLIVTPISILRMIGSVLLVMVLFFNLIVPKEVEAWGAVKNKTVFGSSAMTHQEILKIAYQQLKSDKAIADQMGRFPDINDILQHEGVQLSSTPAVLIWGPEGIGGPDAESSGSKASEHYFNPDLTNTGSDITSTSEGTGAAPEAVGKYYLSLLEEMYLPGQGKDKAISAKGAAWASHFLADINMPYHTKGMPADLMSDASGSTLTVEQSGGPVFWNPLKIKYDDDQPVLSSIPQPPFGWGGKTDFGSAMTDYTQYQGVASTRLRDWFDPWYMNGGPNKHLPGFVKWAMDNTLFLSEKNWLIQIAASSHASWEAWAAKEFQSQRSNIQPDSYSAKWKNGAPTLFLSTHLENQAKQAEAFTVSAAKETQSNKMTWLKDPILAINNANEKSATLWRAALTALRPSIQVTPDANNPKLLRVLATIQNVESVDPAKNVQAKLTVDGGKVRVSDTQLWKGEVTPANPAILSWEVDTADPQSCNMRLEVICNYEHTPDLQYAMVESSRNRMTVEATPGNVKAGDKVKLTVKVQPAAKTQLNITNWGPLNKGSATFTTNSDGVFTKEYTVSKTAKDKMYTVKIEAPKLNLIGSVSIGVGLNIMNHSEIYIRFAEGTKALFSYSNREGQSADFILLGDNPYVKITSWEGDYTLNGTLIGGNPGETGTLKATFDANYQTITRFTWEYNYLNKDAVRADLKSMSMTINGGGLKKGELKSIYSYTPDFYYKLTGDEICRTFKIKINTTYMDGTTGQSNQIVCNPDAISEFLFRR